MREGKKTSFAKLFGRIVYLMVVIILCVVIVKIYHVYASVNFNDFQKSVYRENITQFSRDSEVKYNGYPSYKISNIDYNDAMFSTQIAVKPNTPYRVSCMVKTNNVQAGKAPSSSGAHISIRDTTEKSKSITGTNDWQKIEMIFNSRNRDKVDVGFRLGGYNDAVGEAWFSNFKIEQGISKGGTDWHFVCFIFENIDVNVDINGETQNVKLSMSNSDILDMRENMQRFKTSCQELSGNNMSVTYDIVTIKEPILSLTFDEKNGYYVAPENVEELIKPYMEENEFDHIFIAVRMGDINKQKEIPVYDWIGLGGMDYYGIGFSNIRLPNNSQNYIYKYDTRINTFPEEVFIHEFLHSLERDLKEYGYTIPALHDNELYGYKDQKLTGLKKWYEDYMRCNIKDENGNKIGLDKIVYTLKPSHKSEFEFPYELDAFYEPKNVIEEVKNNFMKLFSTNNIEKSEET